MRICAGVLIGAVLLLFSVRETMAWQQRKRDPLPLPTAAGATLLLAPHPDSPLKLGASVLAGSGGGWCRVVNKNGSRLMSGRENKSVARSQPEVGGALRLEGTGTLMGRQTWPDRGKRRGSEASAASWATADRDRDNATATWVVTSAEWASAGYGLDLKVGRPVYLYVTVGLVGTHEAKATANLSVGVAKYDPLPGENLTGPTITNSTSTEGPTIPLSSDSLSARYRFTFVWAGTVNRKTTVTADVRLTDAKNSQVDRRTGGACRSSGEQVTLSNDFVSSVTLGLRTVFTSDAAAVKDDDPTLVTSGRDPGVRMAASRPVENARLRMLQPFLQFESLALGVALRPFQTSLSHAGL